MPKRVLEPSTVLYPVPVVLVSCGHQRPNIITVNRIASLAAEPPVIGISLRPSRLSHTLISQTGEFVVNLPTADMLPATDLCGTSSGTRSDKFASTGLTAVPALKVKTPLIAECLVNIECRVIQTVNLVSHDLFLAQVEAVHADDSVLDERGEIDYLKANPLAYGAAIVRERPEPRRDTT
ncbi:MAG: flavin reductase family protein [Chloroflexi bacterium]|nr:flavin reductase family protein [Chloroflexota bacterium]